jgi:4'-phosphopantetheinyl transferase
MPISLAQAASHEVPQIDTPGPAWEVPPQRLVLAADELHLWQADLDDSRHHLLGAWRLLAPDEADRARRFHFERHRRRFVVGRALLRTILGHYLGGSPADFLFAYAEWGKPFVLDRPGGPARPPLEFNLSHSEHMAVYALVSTGIGNARRRAVGVDVERVRDLTDMDLVADRFFAESEARVVRALPAHVKSASFFNCWTRKEAYIKAIGTGLARPLDQFSVSFLPGEPPRLVWVAGDPQETRRWSFATFNPADGFVAAAVVAGSAPRPRYWRAPPLADPLGPRGEA